MTGGAETRVASGGTLVKAIVRNEGPLKTIKDKENRLTLMKFPHENHNKGRQ